MKKTALLIAISVIAAVPAFGQSTEFGVLFGGSKRILARGLAAGGTTLSSPGFSFSNSAVDFFYSVEVDPGTMFKINVGRLEGPIGFQEREVRGDKVVTVRRDVDGEVQHAEGLIEYRFSEPFGSTGLFAGIGVYRHGAEGFSSKTDYGFAGGLTGDFPLSRRYGVIVNATYHQTYHDFRPRYLTVSGGLRFGF